MLQAVLTRTKGLFQKGYNLILIARRKDKLQELKDEILSNNKISMDLFSVDLSLPKGGEVLYNIFTKTITAGNLYYS